MKEILKLGMILGIITSVCVGILGAVNSITSPIIKEQKAQTQQLAMQQLLNEAEQFEKIDTTEDGVLVEVFKGFEGENYVGAVAKVAPEGYAGAIEILVGVNPSGEIVGIEILSHTETPGLGANITKDEFKLQYQGKVAPLETIKGVAKENEISAITGATVSTDAVTDGVNMAVEFIVNNQQNWE